MEKAIAEPGEVDSSKNNQGADYLQRADPLSKKNRGDQNRKNNVDVAINSSFAVPDPLHRGIPDDVGEGDGKDARVEKGSPALK